MKKYVNCLIMALTIITLSSTAVFAEERSTTETVQETVGLDLSQYKDGEVIPAEAIPDNHYPVINNQEGRSVATSTYTYALKAADSQKRYKCSNLRYKNTDTSMYLKLTKAAGRVGFKGYGRRDNGLSVTSGSAYLSQGQSQYVKQYLFEWGYNEMVGFEATPLSAQTFNATILWSPDVVR